MAASAKLIGFSIAAAALAGCGASKPHPGTAGLALPITRNRCWTIMELSARTLTTLIAMQHNLAR